MKNNKITNWLLAGASCLLAARYLLRCGSDILFAGRSGYILYKRRRGLVSFQPSVHALALVGGSKRCPRPVDGGRNGRYVRADPW